MQKSARCFARISDKLGHNLTVKGSATPVRCLIGLQASVTAKGGDSDKGAA